MKRTIRNLRFFGFFLTLNILLLLHATSYAATHWVSSPNDSGLGTLRQCVGSAAPGDNIQFANAMTINLSSSISIPISNLTIDATTVSGWSSSANKVTISGGAINAFTTSTTPTASNLTIKGLIFSSFSIPCIRFQDAPGFTVLNCWFGLLGNGMSSVITNGSGISINGLSSYGNIGSSNPNERNIFYTSASTASACILMNNTGVSATNLIKIQGNYFGTNYSGSSILSLTVNSAIKVSDTKYVQIGGMAANEGNLIDGCASGSGIWFAGSSNFNITIQGNKIGTLATNSNYNGILMGADQSNFLIEKNIINNSQNYGIVMPTTFSTYSQIKISQNSFSSNIGGGISSNMYPSNINAATPFKVVGNAYAPTANATVEIYSWDGIGSTSAQGTTFIASVTADGTGAWSYTGSFTVGQKLVITTTPPSGNPSTTTFSPPFTVTACPSTVSAGSNQTVCATTSTVSLAGSGSFIVAPYTWSIVNGTGTLTNPTSLGATYNLGTSELNNTTVPIVVTLKFTATTNTCQPTISNQMTITITPKPVANAGADITTCVSASSVPLSGSVTTATGGTWSGGGGSFSPNANTLNASYTPTYLERTTGFVYLTLTTTGNGTCATSSHFMKITFSPDPTVNAGADRTICVTNSNIIVSGTITGAPSGTWTSSGSGTFNNANALNTIYTPSNADKTAGSVTLRLTSSGGVCTSVSDIMDLTIKPCLIDPQLSFQSFNAYISSGSDPFKLPFAPLKSTGAITYEVVESSTLGASACATVGANGYVTTNCVETVRVIAYQAQKGFYDADTAYYTLYIGKAITKIKLESRGAVVAGADFSLLVKTNYDEPLTYVPIGGDLSAINITTDGIITPLAEGTVYIRASAPGNANYQAASSNDAVITIYPKRTQPVAINDTLELSIAEQKTIDIGSNDFGTTASIAVSPSMLLDIDAENSGVQNKYFKPGVGIFTVDEVGMLTFTAFEGFIGDDFIEYTVTDADGIVSNPAKVVLIVTSPVDNIALKANEIITANNDNLNEALVIGYTDLTKGNDLLVVDAAGNRLYYESNYQNNWRATNQAGENLGNGVYYFIFREFNDGGTEKRQLKGNFTVIR